jgi:hypothetical protein
MWLKKRLLIWGKTYPEFSKSYYETVCTGAVDSDTGRLVRIYPITLRYMTEPFAAYDWIEAEIERNTSDFRPESYRIRQDSIKVAGKIDTKDAWEERSKWVLRDSNVFSSVKALQDAERNDHTSLGLVRPKRIIRVYAKHRSDEERQEWDAHREQAIAQKDLFVDAETKTKDLVFMPIQYRAVFECADPACPTQHDMSILDWGVYVLSRKLYRDKGGGAAAEKGTIERIYETMDVTKKDSLFFLGNTKAHSTNFMIVGMYYPPRVQPAPPKPKQLGLF